MDADARKRKKTHFKRDLGGEADVNSESTTHYHPQEQRNNNNKTSKTYCSVLGMFSQSPLQLFYYIKKKYKYNILIIIMGTQSA